MIPQASPIFFRPIGASAARQHRLLGATLNMHLGPTTCFVGIEAASFKVAPGVEKSRCLSNVRRSKHVQANPALATFATIMFCGTRPLYKSVIFSGFNEARRVAAQIAQLPTLLRIEKGIDPGEA